LKKRYRDCYKISANLSGEQKPKQIQFNGKMTLRNEAHRSRKLKNDFAPDV